MPEAGNKGAIDFLRGIGRSVTADVIGGPVDLATLATNALLRSGSWGAEKLGLIDEPLPSIDPYDVPLSSDWFAKNTPLDDPGDSTAYDMGRLLPMVAGLGMAATGGRAASALRNDPLRKQRGAMYLDRQGQPQGDEFAVYHNKTISRNIRPEYNHPSFAITHEDKPLLSDFGSDYLVPDPSKLEPRTTPTRLHGSDAYTPRWGVSFAEDAADNMPDGLSVDELDWDTILRRIAQGRLQDRAIPNMPGKGENLRLVFGEDARTPEQLGDFMHKPPAGAASVDYLHMLSREPLYRSIEEFLRSPYGGQRLAKEGSGKAATQQFSRWQLNRMLDIVDNIREGGPGIRESIRKLPREKRGKISVGAQFTPLIDLLRGGPKGYAKYLTPEAARDEQLLLNEMFDQVARRAPSAYGEFKRYGPMGINGDNFAGAIFGAPPANKFQAMSREMRAEKLQKRGIPTYEGGVLNPGELFELIKGLNTYGLTRGRDDSGIRHFQELRLDR